MSRTLSDTSRLLLVASIVAIVFIGLTIGGVVLFHPNPKSADRVPWKWIRFSLAFGCLIWFSLNAYWRLRKSLPFWGIFATFLLVHGLGLGYLYSTGQGLSTLEVSLVSGLAFGCMALVIYWVLGVGPEVRRQHSKSPWIPTP